MKFYKTNTILKALAGESIQMQESTGKPIKDKILKWEICLLLPCFLVLEVSILCVGFPTRAVQL